MAILKLALQSQRAQAPKKHLIAPGRRSWHVQTPMDSGAADQDGAASGSVRDPSGQHDCHAAEYSEKTPDLFREPTPDDMARIHWLRANASDAHCNSLFLQICEWKNQDKQGARRLARRQKIVLSRQSQRTLQDIIDAVRKHFRETIELQRDRRAAWKRLLAHRQRRAHRYFALRANRKIAGDRCGGHPNHDNVWTTAPRHAR